MTESLMLALAGGAIGLLLAHAALVFVPGLLPPTVPLLTTPALDPGVAAFVGVIALGCGLIVSAWPVVRVSGSRPAPRGASSGPRGAVYRALVVGQVALTVALVVVASLLAQSLWSVQARDAGFVIDSVLVADLSLPQSRYTTPDAVVAFEDQVLTRVSALPGVEAAALAYDHPLEANWIDGYAIVGDVSDRQDGTRGSAELRIVSPGYFSSLRVDLIDGRLPEAHVGPGSAGVAVVNVAFSRSVGVSPVLGRRLLSASPRRTWGDRLPGEFEIIGIVEDERFRGLEEPSRPAVYLTTRQFPQTGVSVLVRTATDSEGLTGAVRSAVREVEPGATFSARTLSDILDEQLVTRRVTTDVVSGFAGLALALAALGLYGLLVVAVASRAKEFGVRLALGATPGGLARHVVGESLRKAAIGVAAGLALAALVGRLIESLLVGVRSWDPATFAMVALILLGVAAGAALVPARRAATVDPVRTLRSE